LGKQSDWEDSEKGGGMLVIFGGGTPRRGHGAPLGGPGVGEKHGEPFSDGGGQLESRAEF